MKEYSSIVSFHEKGTATLALEELEVAFAIWERKRLIIAAYFMKYWWGRNQWSYFSVVVLIVKELVVVF